MPPFPKNIAVLDFESSGIGPNTWPVEVGWITGADQTPTSRLIRPHERFSQRYWMPAAEAMHGLSYQHLLDHGLEPHLVLAELTAQLENHLVVSDNPRHDHAWLTRLCDVCSAKPPFDIHPLEDAIRILVSATNLSYRLIAERANAHLRASGTTPHRAGPDALKLMNAMRAAIA